MKKILFLVLIALTFFCGMKYGRHSSPMKKLEPAWAPKPSPAADPAPADNFPVNLKLSTEITAPYHATWGVPMPRGLIKDTNNLILADRNGDEIPSQYRVLSKWRDGSIKSVLISVLTKSGDKNFQLRHNTTASRDYTSNLKIKETPTAIMESTGKIQVELNRLKFNLWGGDIIATDLKTKTRYQASLFSKPSYQIIESGPIRNVIRIQGKLTSLSGSSLTDFIIWLTAYADRDYILMRYTLVDPRPENDVNTVTGTALELEEYGFVFPFAGKQYAFGGQKTVHEGSIAPNKEYYLFQDGQMNFVDGNLEPWTFEYTADDERTSTDPNALAHLALTDRKSTRLNSSH